MDFCIQMVSWIREFELVSSSTELPPTCKGKKKTKREN
jgi:hypothetical protein